MATTRERVLGLRPDARLVYYSPASGVEGWPQVWSRGDLLGAGRAGDRDGDSAWADALLSLEPAAGPWSWADDRADV